MSASSFPDESYLDESVPDESFSDEPFFGRLCPCGLPGTAYEECCGKLHRDLPTGRGSAVTAEQLMRSRYSAFVVRDASYLLLTWHPVTRPEIFEFSTDPSSEPQWTGLEILATTGGSADDKRGSVEFAAHFIRGGLPEVQRENSSFRRQNGLWVYVGEV